MDRNLLNVDIVNFKICTGIYSSRIAYICELGKNDLNYSEGEYLYYEKEMKGKPFQEKFNLYLELMAKYPTNWGIKHKCISRFEEKNPEVKRAYYELGEKKVIELKYHLGNIKRELSKIDVKNNMKLKRLIIEKFGFNKPYTVKDTRRMLKDILTKLEINASNKSTLLELFFQVKNYHNKVNGKTTEFLIIEKELI